MNINAGTFELNALSSNELTALANSFTTLPPLMDNTIPPMSNNSYDIGVAPSMSAPTTPTRTATTTRGPTTTTSTGGGVSKAGVTKKASKPRRRDMEKNRLAAKACRERKKAEFEMLRAQVSAMAKSNEEMLREIAELRGRNAALVSQLEANGVKVEDEAKYATMYMGGENGNATGMSGGDGMKIGGDAAAEARSIEAELAALTEGLIGSVDGGVVGGGFGGIGSDEGVPDGSQSFYDGLFV